MATARDKNRARSAVSWALKKGTLTRQPCEVCGAEKTDAHHDNYDEPLGVRWLCRKHHRGVHVEVKIPALTRPGDTISLRRFLMFVNEINEPVRVAAFRGNEYELLGVWIPAWMVDSFELPGGRPVSVEVDS
jgi:hypothetical protein